MTFRDRSTHYADDGYVNDSESRPYLMSDKKAKAVSTTPKSVEVNELSAKVGYDYMAHVSFRE